MNVRVILRLLGIITFVVAGSMAIALLWSVYGALRYGESDWIGFLEAIGISMGAGVVLYFAGRAPVGDVLRREGFAVVGLAWILAGALGALPYVCSGTIPGVIDAYFESVSGFTTTGSSILTPAQIDSLPHGIHFWRCFTQWMGGMGIVVLFVAILPFLRASGKKLFFNEVPGPLSESLQPRVRDTAMVLWLIYLGFSAVLVVILMVEEMSFFEAVCHSCTTMSTGGFSTRGESIAAFGVPVQVTIIIFMTLAGVNFGLYFRVMRGDWKILGRDPELRFYIFLLVICTGLVAVELYNRGNQSVDKAVLNASFQTVGLMTTTGYGTDSFDAWPDFSKSLMVVLMFVGGCAGSTGGGMKVIRILVLIKHALIETEHAFRPQTVRSLRVGKVVIEESTRWTILAFFAIIMGTMVFGTLLMAALGLDAVSAMSSVAATLNNIGPGLGSVHTSFADVHPVGKLFLSLLMVTGRLELFAILVLFSPALWKGR